MKSQMQQKFESAQELPPVYFFDRLNNFDQNQLD